MIHQKSAKIESDAWCLYPYCPFRRCKLLWLIKRNCLQQLWLATACHNRVWPIGTVQSVQSYTDQYQNHWCPSTVFNFSFFVLYNNDSFFMIHNLWLNVIPIYESYNLRVISNASYWIWLIHLVILFWINNFITLILHSKYKYHCTDPVRTRKYNFRHYNCRFCVNL